MITPGLLESSFLAHKYYYKIRLSMILATENLCLLITYTFLRGQGARLTAVGDPEKRCGGYVEEIALAS